MKDDHWLTLVIFAYDRPAILDRTVRSLFATLPDGVEILISVNEKPSSIDSVIAVTDQLRRDLNIRVARTGSRYPMTDHFNFAWKKVETPYFMLLGDDDGVSSHFLDVAKGIIDVHGPSVVRCLQAYVVLEDLGEFFPEGRVLLPKNMTGELSTVTAIDELRANCSNLSWSSNMFAVIPTELVRGIERRCGRWCWGMSPDVTGGSLLLAELASRPDIQCWRLDSAATVTGQSKHSNAASVLLGRKKGRAKEFSRELGEESLYPTWAPHRVSVEVSTDLLLMSELVNHYYPDLLRPVDQPDPSVFMPPLIASAMPHQVACAYITSNRWRFFRPPPALLAIRESIDRYGKVQTAKWVPRAVAIWSGRVSEVAKRSVKERLKGSIPQSMRPRISGTLKLITHRDLQWQPYRGLGNWDSPNWTNVYLGSAADVASMKWLNGTSPEILEAKEEISDTEHRRRDGGQEVRANDVDR